MLLNGCSKSELSVNDTSNFKSLVLNNSNIIYSSSLISGVLSVNLIIDGKKFEISADQKKGIISLNGHDNTLTKIQSKNLEKFANSYAEDLKGKSIKLTQEKLLLLSMSSYLSKSPEGFVFNLITMNSLSKNINSKTYGASIDPSAIICIKKGGNLPVSWTDQQGTRYKNMLVGSIGKNWEQNSNDFSGTEDSSYACMGRCGAGCGSSWIPSSYTQACLNHDSCSLKNKSSGGAFDANCGQAYIYAMPSWLAGTWYGCNGD